MRLFHVSEDFEIARFEPRPTERHSVPAVWAIEEHLLPLYLTPRDCPRVCFRAGPDTTDEDRDRFFHRGGAQQVVAIEGYWFPQMMMGQLALYEMPADAPWTLQDEAAGYWVCPEAVEPVERTIVDSLAGQISQRGFELRVVPSLIGLADEVVKSSVIYNLIRMENAEPVDATES